MKKKQSRSRALRDAFLTESNDQDLDDVFAIWAQPEVIRLINEFGEIENPIPLGIRMLKDVPEFRKISRKASKALIWG